MKKSLITMSIAVASLVFVGCSGGGSSSDSTGDVAQDSAVAYAEGKVFYADGSLFGATRMESPALMEGVDLYDVNGNKVGFVDIDGLVTNAGGEPLSICQGTFNNEGLLAGNCSLSVNVPAPVAVAPVKPKTTTTTTTTPKTTTTTPKTPPKTTTTPLDPINDPGTSSCLQPSTDSYIVKEILDENGKVIGCKYYAAPRT